MMFPNPNQQVVRKLTARSLKANRTRNRFVLVAILLTTWLITSFFSIGLSYLKSVDAQEQRLQGTMADVYLSSPTEGQLQKLQELSYVKALGLQSKIGNVMKSSRTGNLNLALFWYDAGEWSNMRKPVMKGLEGRYPQEKNEIAIPVWILDQMGIDDPKVGMNVPLTFETDAGGVKTQVQETFILSGWFTEYSHIHAGNNGIMLVSEALAKAYNVDLRHSGAVSILFKSNKDMEGQIARLQQDIKPGDKQRLTTVSTMMESSSDTTATTIGYGGIILFVMLSGYLLIYNVLYISVSRDTRYYGLLKTLGTTQRQIKKIVRGQAVRLALIGIPLGLLAGAVTAFVIVPMGLKSTSLETGVQISFHPVIFAGAALFAWITTMVSCIKPASIAGKVSPVEAVRYTDTRVKAKAKRGKGGSKLHRMALRNIFRVKKRAVVVFLSLFMGLTTFLVVTTVLMSMDPDNLVAQYMENDFVLQNETMAPGFEGESNQPKITEELVTEISGMKGVTSVYKTYRSFAKVQYDPRVFGKYVDAFAASYHTDRPTDAQLSANEQMFVSNVIAIESGQLKEIIKKTGLVADVKRFENGEIALLGPVVGIGGLETGPKISFHLQDSDVKAELEIGGIGDFSSLISFYTMAPNIFISPAAMEKLQEHPLIEKLSINAREEDWPQVSEQLHSLIGKDRELKLESRMQWQEQLKSAKLTMYILGGGIGLILALIGILNYVNIMYTGVVARRMEFAVMESIGMTSKQLRKLLLFEGAGYALISSTLVASLGTLLSYGAYSLFSQEADYAIFYFPYIPLSIAIILVFTVCLSIPLIAYRQIKQASIVERLRQVE